MYPINGPGATPENKFTDGDPVVPTPPTTVTAQWLNTVQDEITTVVAAAGITPSTSDNGQLLKAMRSLGVQPATTLTQGTVQLGKEVRTATAGDLTLYVRTDGNDTTGDGSANTAAKAFKTVQAAVTGLSRYDLRGRLATIQIAAGTYDGAVDIGLPVLGSGLASLDLKGAGATTILKRTGTGSVLDITAVRVGLNTLKVQVATGQTGVGIHVGGVVGSSGLFFEGSSSSGCYAVYCYHAAFFGLVAGVTAFMGSFTNHFLCDQGTIYVTQDYGGSLSVSGSVITFATATNGGLIKFYAPMAGTVTGTRYWVNWNGAISVAGGGLNALPGSTPGGVDTATGGIYA